MAAFAYAHTHTPNKHAHTRTHTDAAAAAGGSEREGQTADKCTLLCSYLVVGSWDASQALQQQLAAKATTARLQKTPSEIPATTRKIHD